MPNVECVFQEGGRVIPIRVVTRRAPQATGAWNDCVYREKVRGVYLCTNPQVIAAADSPENGVFPGLAEFAQAGCKAADMYDIALLVTAE